MRLLKTNKVVAIFISVAFVLMIGLEPILVSAQSVSAGAAPVALSSELYPYVEFLSGSDKKAVLNFSPAQPGIDQETVNGAGCQTASIAGLSALSAPNMPDLPVQGIMLAIPAGAEPTLKITHLSSQVFAQSSSLCPGTQVVERQALDGFATNDAPLLAYAPYSKIDQFLPVKIAEIVETGYIRSQRYVQIRVFPLQYNAATGTLRYYDTVQLELTYNAPAGSLGTYVAEPYFEDILRNTLPNYAEGLNWRKQTVPTQDSGQYETKDDGTTPWMTPEHGADYLIISHEQFLDEVQTLANHRQSQGLQVEIIDVQDIYAEMGAGILAQEAIKGFISYTYNNWQTRPSFVLLVGDGYVYFAGQDESEINFIPPYLDDVDPWTGETSTDNRYVCVSGNDILPDMYIGRFPVGTDAEAQEMVSKAIAYETNPPAGAWNDKLLFLAGAADANAGNFPASSNQAAALIPADYSVSKLYVGEITGFPSIKDALIAGINQGNLVVHYFGHGAPQLWGSRPQLLHYNDLSGLTNANMLPFFMPMTCVEGYFIYPRSLNWPSLSESAVRQTNGGAIASFSPAGDGLHNGHVILSRSILTNLVSGYHNQLGYLTTQAKYTLAATTTLYNDLIETYHLFGDPALRLNINYATPEAPVEISAQGISLSEIQLTWDFVSTTASELRLERSPNGVDNWEQIAVLPTNTIIYVDSGLPEGTLFTYRLRAFRSGDLGVSAYSNLASATTLAEEKIFLPLIQR